MWHYGFRPLTPSVLHFLLYFNLIGSSTSVPALPATLPRQSAVWPGLCPSQPGRGRLFWTGVSGPAQDDGERCTHWHSHTQLHLLLVIFVNWLLKVETKRRKLTYHQYDFVCSPPEKMPFLGFNISRTVTPGAMKFAQSTDKTVYNRSTWLKGTSRCHIFH